MAAGAPEVVTELEDIADGEPLTTHLLDDADYLETGTFIIFNNDGSVIFIQSIVSSVGMYTHQPGVNLKICPGPALAKARGSESPLQWSAKFARKDIRLDDSRRSMAIGKHVFKYVPAADDGSTRAEYKVALPASGGNAIGDLRATFTADSPSFMISDGKVVFGVEPEADLDSPDATSAPYCRNVFPMARAQVSGELVLADGSTLVLSGRGFVSRLLQNVKAHKIANTWSLAKFDSDHASLAYVSFLTPPSYGSQWISFGALIVDSELVAVTTDNSCATSNEVKDDTGYVVPHGTALNLSGKALAGQSLAVPGSDVFASMVWEHSSWIDKFDILSAIPWILRMIVKTFIAAPWSYRFYDPATLMVSVTGADEASATREFEGMVLREFIFLNPPK
ncbi:Svf1 family protein [Thecamonas trahens ATCC 50062]|uniref:Svf1 family protein n=1 Tax=Thecamonas trahens ATCC 50062 TaxID=461836 RepID=A0A0L0DPI4_THETB|nr:Svf1 family protein [Thecamonas trahens ATCC 50062]KNC54219.1 Svf1 family protein [Thecamonas trahens ATCC 50062]|eukprot:XP_013753858.1 Svf1 family protein [Thecamonas trahens ATCC 50062]